MKLLLTGFEAWAGKINPSGMIAKRLNGARIGELDVVGVELPEDFYRLPRLTGELIRKERPDIIISMGWDYTKQVKVEKVALNIMNSFFGDDVIPDNSGNKPKGEKIFKNGDFAIESSLPAEGIVLALKRSNIPATISYHAGTHCCNTTMYSFLYNLKKLKVKALSGFVHLPPLPEMVSSSYLSLSMPFDKQLEAARIVIQACSDFMSMTS